MSRLCHMLHSPLFSCFSGPMHQGQVSASYFRILTRIHVIHSRRIRQALESFLVYGVTRKVACEQSGATLSYFSVKLHELQRVHLAIIELYQTCSPSGYYVGECKRTPAHPCCTKN